jgi:hypothetical protein
MLRGSVLLKTAFAGLALAAATGPLSAQERAAAGANVEVRRLSNILKTKVIIQEDKPAGEIVDVVYNEGGCIDYYVASYDNRQYVVPFDGVQYRAADRVVFIDIAPAQFERVHFFAPNQWPDVYAPTFREQVYTSFNIRAGGRNRTTFRQGVDVNVDVRNRDRDRDGDRNRDRDGAPDRNRPEANDRDRDRPAAGTREGDRPEPRPEAGDRPSAEPREKAPAPPKPGVDAKPGRDESAPPRADADKAPDRGAAPPRPGANPGSDKTPEPRPEPKADDKKPLAPPPVVPK